jgi:hypothetical protein
MRLRKIREPLLFMFRYSRFPGWKYDNDEVRRVTLKSFSYDQFKDICTVKGILIGTAYRAVEKAGELFQ